MKLTSGKGNSRSNATLSGFSAFWRSRRCLGSWLSGVLALSGFSAFRRCLGYRRSRCSVHLCRQPCQAQILRKGKGTRKGKGRARKRGEKSLEKERKEAPRKKGEKRERKKKLLKNKWREEIWSQIWRWILT
jgi:hypothetical protein